MSVSQSAQSAWTICVCSECGVGPCGLHEYSHAPDCVVDESLFVEVVPASRLEVTDEMVDRAAEALHATQADYPGPLKGRPEWIKAWFREPARAALSAALGEPGMMADGER